MYTHTPIPQTLSLEWPLLVNVFLLLLLTSVLKSSSCTKRSDRCVSLRSSSSSKMSGRMCFKNARDDQDYQQRLVSGGSSLGATAQFALDLYKQQASKEKGNVFFSPFSIHVALAMTLAGAGGQTADEMRTTLNLLNFSNDPESHKPFKKLLKDLNDLGQSSVSLELANRMYVQKDFPILEAFQTTLQNFYLSSIISVNFAQNTEGARQDINNWVERQTRNKIKELIKGGILNELTRLVLVNAIYFKGNWAKKFDGSQTSKEDFFVDDKTPIAVDMMHQKARFPHGFSEELDCAVLELPYVGKKLSMLVLLPNEVNGLKTLERKLSVDALQALMNSLHEREVIVTFPKFQMSSDMSLVETLSNMGMPTVFNPQSADLSSITGSNNLFLSAVLHKAFIEVNEEGTEAAAATAAVITMRALIIPPEFNANHPFLLLIHDNTTNTILFLGRLVNPTE